MANGNNKYGLKTNFANGDYFYASDANGTNIAVLELSNGQTQITKEQKALKDAQTAANSAINQINVTVSDITNVVGDGELETDNKTIIGAINELKDNKDIKSINEKEIDSLF